MLDCRTAVARMWAYLSQGLDDQESDSLEEHLGVCQRCCGELEFSRQLRQRIAAAGARDMPPAVRARLGGLLIDPDRVDGHRS